MSGTKVPSLVKISYIAIDQHQFKITMPTCAQKTYYAIKDGSHSCDKTRQLQIAGMSYVKAR